MVFESGVVPEDWRSAVIVPLYKGKGEKTECKNYSGIGLLSVIRRVTGGLIDDEQEDFRAGRGCVDQVFTRKEIGEKARGKKGRVYVGFIDLEKAYDRFNREALCQVLRMYDVGSKLLNVIKSMYVGSSAHVRVKGGETKRFMIDSGVRQVCIMLPWLFNVYMDAVMQKISPLCPLSCRLGHKRTSTLQRLYIAVISRQG